VYLYSVSGGDTTVVDSYAYTTNEVKDNRAVGRQPAGVGAWVLFDGLNPYTGTDYVSTGCVPSPGGPTDCATRAQEMSWGRVKSQYIVP